MSAAGVAVQQPQQAPDQHQAFEEIPGQQVQYVMQAPMPQGVFYAQAPHAVAYAPTQPIQYTYMAPAAGQVYVNAGAEDGQQLVLQDVQQVCADGMEAQQVTLQDGQQVVGQFAEADTSEAQQAIVQEGQQVVQQDAQLAFAAPEGVEVVQAGADVEQPTFVGTPVVSAPARVNVSPEIFAKLVAGGQLTPEEMAQLSGQPAPVQEQPASTAEQPTPEAAGAPQQEVSAQPGAAPGSTEAADKSEKKDETEESGSKQPLKAAKRKNKSCC